MPIKQRSMAREPWPRVLRREYRYRDVHGERFDGAIGLLRMVEVSAPIVKRALGRDVCILDDGYCWLQLAPRGKMWWLTVMFDENDQIVQYYFDVTRENVLAADGASYFHDLFLDVVAMPNGEAALLDEDELQAALEAGEIAKDEFDAAYRVARGLLRWIATSLPEIEALALDCERILKEEP